VFRDKTYGGLYNTLHGESIQRKGHPSKYSLLHAEFQVRFSPPLEFISLSFANPQSLSMLKDSYALKVRSRQISYSIVRHLCSNLEAISLA
jgi:hypothetical protein